MYYWFLKIKIEMSEIIAAIFGTALTLALYIGFFLLIRKVVLWYWKVNRVVSSVEKMYELQMLLHADEIREKRLKLYNKHSKKEVEMSIKEYLAKENKDQYILK